MAGEEVYGADPGLRAECEIQRIGYVLAIGRDRRIPIAAGPVRAEHLLARLPRRAWQPLCAGPGAKGRRVYDWAWIEHPDPHDPSDEQLDPDEPGCWWLLIRRHPRTGELVFYRC